MSNLYIKCSFCHRDKINYKDGNFFLLNFKKIETKENVKIIKDNQKWFCDLHYPVFYNYKNLTWDQAKQKVKTDT
jgi:hypothetical protein